MTRRKKRAPNLRVVTANKPTEIDKKLFGATAALVTLDELNAAARTRLENEDWSALMELCQMPLSAFAAEDRQQAQVCLLLCRLYVLTENRPWYSLKDEGAIGPELMSILDGLRTRIPDFHLRPEFELYFGIARWKVGGLVRSLAILQPAFEKDPSEHLLRHLRRVLERLDAMKRDDWEEDFSEAERQALQEVEAPLSILARACQKLEDKGSPDEALYARVSRYSILWQTNPPLYAQDLADEIRKIPSPEVTELYKPENDLVFSRIGSRRVFNPLGWAFAVEAASASGEGWSDLLRRYPEKTGVDRCDALRLIIESQLSRDVDDALFLQGVEVIAGQHKDDREDYSGQFLLVYTSQGRDELDCGISIPHAQHILLRLVEHGPAKLRLEAEVMALYHAIEASRMYGRMGDDEDVSQPVLEAMARLAQRSLGFTVMLADVAPRGWQRLVYALRALVGHVERQLPYFDTVQDLSYEEEAPRSQDASLLLEEMSRVAALRGSMDGSQEKQWLKVLPVLADAIAGHCPTELANEAIGLMRRLRKDYLQVAPAYLARVEQRAGNQEAAFEAYLRSFSVPGQEAALSEVRSLIEAVESPGSLEHMRQALAAACADAKLAEKLNSLERIIEVRARGLDKSYQYEKTALARWPALNPQARKVLAVLDTIDTYSGYAELGEYAGMTAEWAERHYRRLVADGMVIETKTGYRINEHIRPLLAQEAKHAIVARIIRAGGTSTAVKPVFNSAREFTIYQALVQLCPNHLVFPNSSLQSIFSYDRMKEMVTPEEFSYFLMASVDAVIVSTTTYLPLLAIEVDSVYHDTEKQLARDGKKDRIFAAGGVPLMRLRPAGSPSPDAIRGQVAEHLDELVQQVRADMPGHDQAVTLLQNLTGLTISRD